MNRKRNDSYDGFYIVLVLACILVGSCTQDNAEKALHRNIDQYIQDHNGEPPPVHWYKSPAAFEAEREQ
jgi:hypothetical protein